MISVSIFVIFAKNMAHDGAAVDHLAGERARAQFDVQAMKVYLAGGPHEFEIATRMAQLVANDPV